MAARSISSGAIKPTSPTPSYPWLAMARRAFQMRDAIPKPYLQQEPDSVLAGSAVAAARPKARSKARSDSGLSPIAVQKEGYSSARSIPTSSEMLGLERAQRRERL